MITPARRLLGLAVGLATVFVAVPLRADDRPRSIRLTSPLGRSGLPGPVRIVARVGGDEPDVRRPVRFFVDDQLLATDSDGPPYVTEWVDSNPFEARRIRVETDDGAGGTVSDAVDLHPQELLEEADVLSVVVDASVRDPHGRPVAGLGLQDFVLVEEAVPQQVDAVTAEVLPTRFLLLVDSSQSMAHNIDAVKRAVVGILGLLGPQDDVMVAPFRRSILQVTGPSRDASTLSEAVEAIRSGGTTAILDGLAAASRLFGEAERRRVIVLVTDGYDEASSERVEDVVLALKAANVTVYTISIGGVSGVSVRGEQVLRRFAHETGGRSYFPWTPAEVLAAQKAITEDARQRYRVSYTPLNQRYDGSWRAISLRAARPHLRVHARSGYAAPAPRPVRATLAFTVTADHDANIEIERDDIEVLEDGVVQQVQEFHESTSPVSVVLALDASGSMSRVVPAVQETARAFVDALRPEDRVAVVTFADQAELVHDLTTARWVTHRAIGQYASGGGTALVDGLVESVSRLDAVDGRRVVVVVSDGRDENASSTGPGSARSWADAVARVRDSEATVYAIGLGARVDVERLRALAALSGGEAYFTEDVGGLARQYRRIVDELRRRYVVGFTSTNPSRDGGWRRVDLRLPTPGLHVRSRGGYRAPTR